MAELEFDPISGSMPFVRDDKHEIHPFSHTDRGSSEIDTTQLAGFQERLSVMQITRQDQIKTMGRRNCHENGSSRSIKTKVNQGARKLSCIVRTAPSARPRMRARYDGAKILGLIAICLLLALINPIKSQITSTAPTTTPILTQLNGNNLNQQHPAPFEPVVFKHNELERTSEYWLRQGSAALQQALRVERISERAKNAILFIGDGMSLPTIAASRILYGQLMNKSGEEEQLPFERLPNVALIKTYNLDQQIPDSAATATAILSGVKSNFYTLGVNGNVKLNDTNCARIEQNHVISLIQQAQEAGKSTGIITNTRITHATPAAGYAHVSNRRWECDGHVPGSLEEPCKDIARQLIENEPGRKLNVIMGGGRRCFFGPNYQDPGPIGQGGMRHDGRNLIDQWVQQRRELNATNFAFVNRTRDLRLVDVEKTDFLLGLFSYSHMNYEELRDQSLDGEPSLDEMTQTAIKILSKNPKGFMLLVEGGRIDHAHHENVAGVALRETIALAWAIQEAQKLVSERDTLLAVTADHAHALTINGLAPRGNPILGLSRFRENATQLPYTTLIYGNGPGHQPVRRDPTQGPNSTDSPYYVQYAAIHQEEAFHDGSDVGIFASGPYAHLFQGVQEQSYIAHVFGYSLCIGQYQNFPHCNTKNSNNQNQIQGRIQTTSHDRLASNNVAFGRIGYSSSASPRGLKTFIMANPTTVLMQLFLILTILAYQCSRLRSL